MANLTSRRCPSPDVLRRLCAGGLRSQEEAAITDHIDRCKVCQSTLDEIGACLDATSGMTPHSEPLLDSNELRQRLQKLKEDLPAESRHSVKTFTDLLPWLEPSGEIGRIDEFDLLECVGRGGMGIVFRAHDKSLDRIVAIKVLSPALLADVTAPDRFLREARSAAGVNHPHVVTVHAVSQIRELPYLVMEFVDGESLQERMDREGQLPLPAIITIAKQMAEALAAAHATGVIHRDVKPANVLLDTTTHNAKLTDFGLARVVEGSSLTRSGLLLGTPEFIAPEQVQGAPVDHRADLFSLGSVMYMMCTGFVPFRGPSPMSTMNQVCAGGAKPVKQLNADIPSWLSNLIRSLHATEPQLRPASARSVVDAIHRGEATTNLNDPRVVESPPAVNLAERPHPRKLRKRSRVSWWFPIGGICLLVVIGMVAMIVKSSNSSSDPPTNERSMEMLVERDTASPPRGRLSAETVDEFMELLEDGHQDQEIQLTSSEPYYLPTIEVEGRNVRIFAARDVAPVVYFETRLGEPGLAVIDGGVHLEGLTIYAEAPFDEEQAPEEESDDELDVEPLIQCERASFVGINCRLISHGDGICLRLSESGGKLLNSEVVAGESDSILWQPTRADSLTLTNCVLIGETNISIEVVSGGQLNMERSTFFGSTTIEIDTDDDQDGQLQVLAKANQFDAEESFLVVHRARRTQEAFAAWHGERNLLPLTIASTLDSNDEETARVETLDDWRRSFHTEEVDSQRRVPAYSQGRRQLLDRFRHRIVRAQDLQRPNDNSSDAPFGASLSALGPDESP